MEKAFAAPRIDLYEAQQFALDRQVLQEQGFNRPDILIMRMWSQPMPDFLAIRFYADFQLQDVGAAAEKAGHPADALAAYASVAHFGELLPADSSSYFLQLLSAKYRNQSYEKMIPLLRSQGRGSEAAAVESYLAALLKADASRRTVYASSSGVVASRAALIVQLSGVLGVIFAFATVVWTLCLLALRSKPNLSSALNRFASALCAAPPLLLLSSAALFLAYYPYARPIAQYGSMHELLEGFGPFLMGVYNFVPIGSIINEVWLQRMFWPSVWCAAVALAGASLLWWVRRLRSNRADAA